MLGDLGVDLGAQPDGLLARADLALAAVRIGLALRIVEDLLPESPCLTQPRLLCHSRRDHGESASNDHPDENSDCDEHVGSPGSVVRGATAAPPGANRRTGSRIGEASRHLGSSEARTSAPPSRPFRAPPRPGDPPRLVAAAGRARDLLGWQPRYPGLRAIVETAWNWHSRHPRGYDD